MLKKRMLLISMTLALLIGLMVPSTAISAGPATGTEFSASGFIYVSGEYLHHEIYTGNGGYIDVAVHEPIEGQVLNTDWADIAGAGFASTHTGVAKLNPVDMSLEGSIVGSFTLVAADGSGTLEGHLWADVDAPIGDDGYPAIINNTGTFKINKGTGSLKGSKASGDLSTQLTWDETLGNYSGHITLTGTYR